VKRQNLDVVRRMVGVWKMTHNTPVETGRHTPTVTSPSPSVECLLCSWKRSQIDRSLSLFCHLFPPSPLLPPQRVFSSLTLFGCRRRCLSCHAALLTDGTLVLVSAMRDNDMTRMFFSFWVRKREHCCSCYSCCCCV